MKYLPIELFLLNLLFNPPQQLLEKEDEDCSESKEKNNEFLFSPLCNGLTQFSLSTSFTQQSPPLVIMAAENWQRHQKGTSSPAPNDDDQSADRGVSANRAPLPTPMDEEEEHKNAATESSSAPTGTDEFTLQDQETIQMYQNDVFAMESLNESIEFLPLEFSEKQEDFQLEMPQYKPDEEKWLEQFYPSYAKEPELLPKTFSIDLLEPSLLENVLDIGSLFFNSTNSWNVSMDDKRNPPADEQDETPRYPDLECHVGDPECNSGMKNEGATECCENTSRTFLHDETSSYCNSFGPSSSGGHVKKEEHVDDMTSDGKVEISREPPDFTMNGAASGHGPYRDGSTFGSPESNLWDSENIENVQQYCPYPTNLNRAREQEVVLDPQSSISTNDLLSTSATEFNAERAEHSLVSVPEVFGSPLISHSYVQETAAFSNEDSYDSSCGDAGISPTLMTFDETSSDNVPEMPGSSTLGGASFATSSTGSNAYRDEDLLLEIGVQWTSEQITHASLEDFNKLIAAVKVPQHVEALRGIRKRGKNKLAARRVRSKAHIELGEVRHQVTLLRQRRDELRQKRDLLMQQLNLFSRSTAQENARGSKDTVGLS